MGKQVSVGKTGAKTRALGSVCVGAGGGGRLEDRGAGFHHRVSVAASGQAQEESKTRMVVHACNSSSPEAEAGGWL